MSTFATPEDATLGDAPRGARVLSTVRSPDGAWAVVLADYRGQPPYLYQVLCQLAGEAGWVAGSSGNGPGWSATDPARDLGVRTLWGPAGSTSVTIADGDGTHTVPVANGHFLYAAWNVRAERAVVIGDRS